MMRLARRLAMVGVVLATAVPLLAQTYHGGLRGAVRESGAVVPGVTVMMTNEANGTTRSTVTNKDGEYAFLQIEPGTYTVKISMQGFKTIENKGVHVGTQQFLTMDHTLVVGSSRGRGHGRGPSSPSRPRMPRCPAPSTRRPSRPCPRPAATRSSSRRSLPGVTHTGDPQFIRQQDQTNSSLLSLGGGPRRGNNYTLDGVAIVDIRNRATVIPSIEAVEEVKVQVTTYDAEMGRTGGGVFNMTGKSGSNSLARQPARADAAQQDARPLLLRPAGLRRRQRLLRQARHLLLPLRRLHRRPHRQEQDVLLGLHRGLQDRHHRRLRACALPTAAS